MTSPKITIKDVAAKAGVSVATVSFVMNDKGNLPEETRNHVRTIADELGYRANRRAANLRTGRSRTIGYVIADLSNSGWVDQWSVMIAQGLLSIVRIAGARDYAIVALPPNSPHLLESFGLDAIILNDSQLDDPDIATAHALGIPVVTLDRPGDPRVSLNLNTGYGDMTVAALDALKARGAKKIGLLTEPGGAMSNTQQVSAYETWCTSNKNKPVIVRGSHNRVDIAERVGELLGAGCDGIYSFYGEGPAIMNVLRERGVSVPEDVQLIANVPTSGDDLVAQGIATTVYHIELMTEEPVNVLIDALEGKQQFPIEVTTAWELVLAGSVRSI